MRWRPIVGFESHYSISERGDVMRTARGQRTKPGRILRHGTHRQGYGIVNLFVDGRNHTRLVHRLVAETFLGAAPAGKPLVRHLDGNPSNNHVSNLAWGDELENKADAAFHKEHGIGVAAPH